MFSTSLRGLVVNLVPVRHNSPCQNREGNHGSVQWSPTLLESNKPADMRSFFLKRSLVSIYWTWLHFQIIWITLPRLLRMWCYEHPIRLCSVWGFHEQKVLNPEKKVISLSRQGDLVSQEFEAELKKWKLGNAPSPTWPLSQSGLLSSSYM